MCEHTVHLFVSFFKKINERESDFTRIKLLALLTSLTRFLKLSLIFLLFLFPLFPSVYIYVHLPSYPLFLSVPIPSNLWKSLFIKLR